MRRQQNRRAPESIQVALERRSQQAEEIQAADSEVLRNAVRQALSELPAEERLSTQDALLLALSSTGINIGHHLLVLGIPARTAEELTAPEMAALIRYVRINEPQGMDKLIPVLSAIPTLRIEQPPSSRFSNRAA
jgi:hypothetical protein